MKVLKNIDPYRNLLELIQARPTPSAHAIALTLIAAQGNRAEKNETPSARAIALTLIAAQGKRVS
jgi:hypothetical protein